MLGLSTVPSPVSALPFRAALRDQYGWRAAHRSPPTESPLPTYNAPASISSSSASPPAESRAERRSARLPACSLTSPGLDAGPSSASATKGTKRAHSAASPSSGDSDSDQGPHKRQRRDSSSALSSASSTLANSSDTAVDAHLPVVPNRIFPPDMALAVDLVRLYRRQPASSYIDGGKTALSSATAKSEGAWNAPHSALDLYTPRFTKGVGRTKVGMCPICAEPPARGGEGRKLLLAMKQSAYNYHMMYYHGISATTGLPFSPPIELRVVAHQPRSKIEKDKVREGKCHKCARWIVLDTIKRDHETKIKEQFWWKHASSCHGASRLTGDDGIYVEDDVHVQILATVAATEADGDEP